MHNVRYIYGLYDPRKPGVVMVVGETTRTLRARLWGYITEARCGKKLPSLCWIRKLLADGVQPGIRLLAKTNDKHWRKCERRFISIWPKKNPSLLNVHRGGNGSETGERKIFCECGTKRKRWKSGKSFCPNCRLTWELAWQRDWRRTPKRRAYNRVYQRAYQRTPKMRAYNRDRYHARKLNLTVAEYRKGKSC